MPKIAASGTDDSAPLLFGVVAEAVGETADEEADGAADEAREVPAAGDARCDTKLVNGTVARKVLHRLSAYGNNTA